MQIPTASDVIVAVATGWAPSPVAVVRLSGPGAHAMAMRLGLAPGVTKTSHTTNGEIRLDGGVSLPASGYWFFAPRSYTGQESVELHTIGCLPLVAQLVDQCEALGARRALPGEFTARAFLAGKLGEAEVERVLAAVSASTADAARAAARRDRSSAASLIAVAREQLLDALARVEAAIDFVEEEDVQFITRDELVALLDRVVETLRPIRDQPPDFARPPHVALVGLPNAGKSTLFNALVGEDRVLVSPIAGTTRDVVSADIDVHGVALTLQDSAGRAIAMDDVEAAADQAAAEAGRVADLLVWVHDATQPWTPAERRWLERIPPAQMLLVISKSDLSAMPREAPIDAEPQLVSVHGGFGVEALRRSLAERVGKRSESVGETLSSNVAVALSAVARAREAALMDASPELTALALREAVMGLVAEDADEQVSERVLTRIFSAFCIGK